MLCDVDPAPISVQPQKNCRGVDAPQKLGPFVTELSAHLAQESDKGKVE